MNADTRPIFLVGFMGSGKSTVGRILARRLGFEFIDTDLVTEALAGRSIEAIFRDEGEAAFRRLEWRALQQLGTHGSRVIATGGGLFLEPRARDWIRAHGRSVWLDLPLEACIRRVDDGRRRPLWAAGDPSAFRAMFERRRATYALCALRVDAAAGEPEAVAERILDRLGSARTGSC